MNRLAWLIVVVFLTGASLAQGDSHDQLGEPAVKAKEATGQTVGLQQECSMFAPSFSNSFFGIGIPVRRPGENVILDDLSNRYDYWMNITNNSAYFSHIRTCDDLMKSSAMSEYLNDQITDGPYPGRLCSEETGGRLSWAYPNSAGYYAIGQCSFRIDNVGGYHLIESVYVTLEQVRCCKLPLGN